MTLLSTPTVMFAAQLDGGVLVEFADGRSALFPASFLSAHLPWYAIDMLAEAPLTTHGSALEAAPAKDRSLRSL